MRKLEDYIEIVGDEVIANIYKNAKKLYGKHILNINSTYQGGGVSEMLVSLVPLMNNIGLDAGWRILHGSPDFFTITKKFHNGLQGAEINLSEMKKRLYTQTNENFSTFTHIDHDCVIIHDPQPLPLIRFYKKRQPWIWRCHIDLSEPQKDLWNYLKTFMLKYDVIIVSSEKYKKPELPVEQRIISPAIDPLSLKNKELDNEDILKLIKKARIPTDKPIITQVSRMDQWKDPEGMTIYTRVHRKAKKLIEKGEVIFVIGNNDVLVNAIQRFSTVIAQKSIREGFCLAVTEALWKKKPVVASNVGGIPSQIKDGENGFLLEPMNAKGFADRIVRILQNPKLGIEMGKKGKEFVRKNFLITRLLSDYLDLLNDVL